MREEKGHQISKGLARRGVQGKGGARVKRGQDMKMKQRSCVEIGEDFQKSYALDEGFLLREFLR